MSRSKRESRRSRQHEVIDAETHYTDVDIFAMPEESDEVESLRVQPKTHVYPRRDLERHAAEVASEVLTGDSDTVEIPKSETSTPTWVDVGSPPSPPANPLRWWHWVLAGLFVLDAAGLMLHVDSLASVWILLLGFVLLRGVASLFLRPSA